MDVVSLPASSCCTQVIPLAHQPLENGVGKELGEILKKKNVSLGNLVGSMCGDSKEGSDPGPGPLGLGPEPLPEPGAGLGVGSVPTFTPPEDFD